MAQLMTDTDPDSREQRVTVGSASAAPGPPMLPPKLAVFQWCGLWWVGSRYPGYSCTSLYVRGHMQCFADWEQAVKWAVGVFLI